MDEGITIIGNSNFRNLTMLEEISLPEGLIRIRQSAFSGNTKLEKVTLPDTLTHMESYAFSGCSALKEIHLSNSQQYIGTNAFSKTGLTKITIPATMNVPGFTSGGSTYYGPFTDTDFLAEVTLEDGLEDILEGMFAGMKALKTMYIPASVKSVQEGAFNGCSALTDVYFDGTEAQWKNAVTVKTNNAYLTRATFHFAPETPVEETIEVAVTIPGASNAGITVTAPEAGWKEGENTFSVTCDKVCAVMVSYDGGATYQRLVASIADGKINFTATNMTADTLVTVAVLGDSNGDGNLSTADLTSARAALLGKKANTALNQALCDANKDGALTTADLTALRAGILGKKALAW